MKRFFVFILAAFLILPFVSNKKAYAGAWTVPRYKVWAEYYNKWAWAEQGFTAKRDLEEKPQDGLNWDYVAEPKFEYGFTDWLTGMFSFEYKVVNYKEYDRPPSWGSYFQKNKGVSSVKFGGKVRFIEKPMVISNQLKVSVYPGYANDNGDDASFSNQPLLGRGEDWLEYRVLFSKRLDIPMTYFHDGWKLPIYMNVETGYRWKNSYMCNDIPFLLEGGFWLNKWFLVKGEIDGYLNHDGTGSHEEDYAIWRVGLVLQTLGGEGITRKGTLFNVEIQYGETFWGRNTTAFKEIVMKADVQF